MKILLIEDDAGCRLSIEEYLKSRIAGVEVISEDTFTGGLRRSREADIVVLDLNLGDTDNPAETVHLYMPLFKEIPTIIVSASDGLPCVCDALEHGARAFICKPKLEGMVEAVAEIAKALHQKAGA